MLDKIGVINEQGFVAGNNLGFNPLSESETEKLNKDEKNEDKTK